jgi:hypothetical protein
MQARYAQTHNTWYPNIHNSKEVAPLIQNLRSLQKIEGKKLLVQQSQEAIPKH